MRSVGLRAATFLFFNEFHVHFSLPFRKETTLDCLPMASKPVSAAVFALLVHVFSSSIRAVCHLEHPRIKIYTLYTFYTAIKEGFATASLIHEQTSWSRHINPPVRTPSPAEANVRASRTLPSNQPVDRSRPAVHFDAVSGSILPHQPCLAQVPADGSCKTNSS